MAPRGLKRKEREEIVNCEELRCAHFLQNAEEDIVKNTYLGR